MQNFILSPPGWGAVLWGSPLKYFSWHRDHSVQNTILYQLYPGHNQFDSLPSQLKQTWKKISYSLPLIWSSLYTENVLVQVASPFRLQNSGETNSPIFIPIFRFKKNEVLVLETHSSLGNTNLISIQQTSPTIGGNPDFSVLAATLNFSSADESFF